MSHEKKDLSSEIKTMSIAEFWQQGFLQELNRQFLHPLGIALSIYINPDSDEVEFGEIWDYRDDPEGLMFGEGVLEPIKAANVNHLRQSKIKIRSSLPGVDQNGIQKIEK